MKTLRPNPGAAPGPLVALVAAALLAWPGSAVPAAGQTASAETTVVSAHRPAPEPTTVLVRVLARDAKLLGDGVGGAQVTIADAETGEVLATGVTSGGTGDTDAIMSRRRARGAAVLASPGAAGWTARLELARPTLVEILAEGPLDYPEATARASKTLLLAPGAKIDGDGVVLELNGLIVDELEARPAGDSLTVLARVRMLCSCPTEPDGLWRVERVTARLIDDGRVVAEAPLHFSGETSTYEGRIAAPDPGEYELEVVAADPATANFGRASRSITHDAPADGH